jgi:two-component system sensor histidine kinase/response regulator
MTDKSIRILHVDDVEAEFILLRDMLSTVQDYKFEFQWIPDSQTATQVLHSTRFDVCLVDYYLGVDNGLDLIRRLIAKGVVTPFILMSGQRDPAIDYEASKVGVHQCINKNDITISVLLKAIQSAVQQRK